MVSPNDLPHACRLLVASRARHRVLRRPWSRTSRPSTVLLHNASGCSRPRNPARDAFRSLPARAQRRCQLASGPVTTRATSEFGKKLVCGALNPPSA
jgi:hypothetical protein